MTVWKTDTLILDKCLSQQVDKLVTRTNCEKRGEHGKLLISHAQSDNNKRVLHE